MIDYKKKDKNSVFHLKNLKNANLNEIHTLLKVLELKDFFVSSYMIGFSWRFDEICLKNGSNLFMNYNFLVSQYFV